MMVQAMVTQVLSNCVAVSNIHYFYSDPWANDPIWLAIFFSDGWFNHQLVFFNAEISQRPRDFWGDDGLPI